MTRAPRAASVALFVTLGLVGAFVVSAIAGAVTGDPDGGVTGAAAGGSAARNAGDLDPVDRAAVRVEVLNGAGMAGLARNVTHRLRGVGFDVVYFGNAATFDREVSVVIDRVGAPGTARAVAAALGIDSVASLPDPRLLLDVTVVLGQDWPPGPVERKRFLDRVRDAASRFVPGEFAPAATPRDGAARDGT